MAFPVPPSRLPDEVVAKARQFGPGAQTPAEPRDAATVVLVRPGADPAGGPEVYLLLRRRSMAFAAGMAVFPGGGVDPRDFDARPGPGTWAGPSPQDWAERLGVGPDEAVALVCAAVRETFEESGVLLAGPSSDEVVGDTTGADWEADRLALESHELAFTDLLARRGLVLRTDLLGVWDAWLTPEFEPRRYRTWFFVAVLPEGQRTRDVSTESVSVHWESAATAVERCERGDLAMMPPTYLTCLDVAQHADPAAVLATARERRAEMFMPQLEPYAGGEGFSLTLPDRLRPVVARRRALREGAS